MPESTHDVGDTRLKAIQELLRGSRTYWVGVKWLKNHPSYFALLVLPSLVALLAVVGSGVLFVDHHATVVRVFLFDPGNSWLWIFLYYLAWIVLHVVAFALVLLLGLLLGNCVAAPIYESISVVIEREMTGQVIEISFWRSLRSIPEELKKVALIGALSVLLFLIPGLNILALFAAAFLVGWDVYDYPMARRGWSLAERVKLVRSDFWAILGLGLWLVIPVLHFILLPMAIAGGTILNLERIQRSSLH